MAARNTPKWATFSLMPVGGSGTGAALHLFANVPPAMAVTVAIVVTITTCVAAVAYAWAPPMAEILRQRSMARFRSTVISEVIAGHITTEEAAALLSAGESGAVGPESRRAPARKNRNAVRPPKDTARKRSAEVTRQRH